MWKGAYKPMQWSLRLLKICLSLNMMMSLTPANLIKTIRPVKKASGKGWKILELHGKWWIIQWFQAEHSGLNRNNPGFVQTFIICTWNEMVQDGRTMELHGNRWVM